MTNSAEKKGRLEHLLEEFTDVHGTVLLGMHKELQTLKQDVEQRVEAQISAIPEKIEEACSSLSVHLEQSRCVLDQFDSKGQEAALNITSEKESALTEIAALQEQGSMRAEAVKKAFKIYQTDLKTRKLEAVEEINKVHIQGITQAETVRQEFNTHVGNLTALRGRIGGELEKRYQAIDELINTKCTEAQSALSRERDAGVSDLHVLLGEVDQRRSDFHLEIVGATEKITQTHQEYLKKIMVSIEVADKISLDTQVLLTTAKKQAEDLHHREITLQQRTRQLAVFVGIVVLATIGSLVWLVLKT